MESELLSLRSKIDELELKLGAHPSIASLTQSNLQSSRFNGTKSLRNEELTMHKGVISQDNELLEALNTNHESVKQSTFEDIPY
jgi:hypothetical protein